MKTIITAAAAAITLTAPVAGTAAASAKPAAPAHRTPVVLWQTSGHLHSARRPGYIFLTGGAGDWADIKGIRWSAWRDSSARGKGTFQINGSSEGRVTITLRTPVTRHRTRYFYQLRMTGGKAPAWRGPWHWSWKYHAWAL